MFVNAEFDLPEPLITPFICIIDLISHVSSSHLLYSTFRHYNHIFFCHYIQESTGGLLKEALGKATCVLLLSNKIPCASGTDHCGALLHDCTDDDHKETFFFF